MTNVTAFVREWFEEPRPTFELRRPSARWSRSTSADSHHRLIVSEIIQETPSTRTFVLVGTNGETSGLTYRAGQHLTLLVSLEGATHRRCYSLSSCPDNGGSPAITVKRVTDGKVSRYLHDEIRVGDELRATSPGGNFTIDVDAAAARHVVLIAGGVGITPLIGLAETVLRNEPGSSVSLRCGHRNEGEIIFRERLAKLEREFGERLDLAYALDDPSPEWKGLCGALDGPRVMDSLGDVGAELYYLCGPAPMMENVSDALAAAGIPGERIRTERFTYASAANMPIPRRPARIHFAASGREVTAAPGQTILQAGLAAGLEMPFSCTMGGCGACKIRRVEGEIVMSEPNCLTQSERESGYLLACCSYADKHVVIEGY